MKIDNMKLKRTLMWICLLVCQAHPYEMQAQEGTGDDDETPLVQDGSKETPFLIATAAGLDSIRFRKDTAYYYQLVDHIDLSEYADWQPIGTQAFPFKGFLEGNGFAVRNLKILSGNDYSGLFGYLSGASVKNILFENVHISGGDYTAAIAGYAEESTIAQVFVNGTLHGNRFVGGLAGQAFNSYLRDSYSAGNVEGDYYTGGLLGLATDTTTLNNCYSQTKVLALGDIAGGLVGAFDSITVSPEVRNSFAANVSVTAMGGAAGRISGSEGGNIQYSYGLYTTPVNGKKIRPGQAKYIDGTTKNLSDLQSLAFYEDESLWENGYAWNFFVYWHLDEGGTFPYLQTQTSPAIVTTARTSLIAGRISSRGMEGITLTCYNARGDSLATIVPAGDSWRYEGVFQEGDTLYIVSKSAYRTDACPVRCIISAFPAGNGTKAEPYRITTAEELALLRNDAYLQGAFHFRLENDIDLSGIAGFTPIGNENKYFEGHFHGGNHVIRHLQINRENADYQGLFGRMEYAGTDSLGLIDVRIAGKNNTGALAGEASLSQINSVFVLGEIHGASHVAGGLTGKATDSTLISQCYASCTVSGQDSIGGLAGVATGSSGISDSYATGAVSGNDIIGGLAGQSDTPFKSCYTTAFVKGTRFTGAFAGDNRREHLYCYADTTACGQENNIGRDYDNSQSVLSVSSRKLAEPSSVQGLDDAWEWRQGRFPQLKSFSQSDNPLFKAASALSALPVFLAEGERAERVKSAFIHGANDTITSLKSQLMPDTLFLKDDDYLLTRPFVFVPNHITPALNISCQANDAAYQGEWTNNSVSFSLTDRQYLISGQAITQDSIQNLVANISTPWTACERSVLFEKDTLLEVYFRPLSQAGIRGNISRKYDVKIDKTKPQISFSPNPDFMSEAENAVDSAVIQINYADILSGIREVRWETIDLQPARNGILSYSGQRLTFDKLGRYTLKVTATDNAGNDSIAELNIFVRAKRQISSLSTLTANDENIPLQENKFAYTLTDSIPYSQPEIRVEATPTDNKAITDNQQTYTLQPKNNAIRILVNAEERSFASTYTIHAYRKNNNTSLSGLNIGGTNVPLENGLSAYHIAVPSSVSEAQVSYLLADRDACADISSSYTLGNIKTVTPLTFTVTAESPEITQDYTVYVYRQNSETSLASLTVHGQSLALEEGKYLYELTVPSAVSAVSLSCSLKDTNGATDALSEYALQAPGTNTVITFNVYAEDRNVKQTYQVNVRRQSNRAEIGSITFGGEVYDSGNIPVLQISCRETSGHIGITAVENGTVSFLTDNQEITANEYDLPLPRPGNYTLNIKITPEDATQPPAVYPLQFSKWFGEELFFSRWDKVIAVKKSFGDYVFDKVWWYREGNPQELGRDPSKGYIRLEEEGAYYAVLEGRGPEGAFTGVRTCPFPYQLPDIRISIKPNPVIAGQSLVVTAEMPEQEFEHAALLLVNASGAIVMQQALKGKETHVVMPTTPGNYILKVVTGSGTMREFKIMVV